MKVIQVSDEVYDRLKNWVVDPFDDTPECVISRLMDIVDKARSRWSAWDDQQAAGEPQAEPQQEQANSGHSWSQQAEAVL
jgi:hypothetical protein